MIIEDGQSILLTGDSITDCGRAHPVGFGAGLGDGYVALVDRMLRARYPERPICVLNTGISGNRVIDLETRWDRDVLALNPDLLSILIGINDVWRQFDDPENPDQVDIDRYEFTYRSLLERARPALKGLVLMAPYLIESNVSDPMRERMISYGAVVERLARAFDAVFVNLQSVFDAYLVHQPAQSLSGDRIHPDQTGHLIIAKSFLNAVGFERV